MSVANEKQVLWIDRLSYFGHMQINYFGYRCQGFTLLELLIAMTLSTVLMVVLVSGFSLISKNWEKQDNRLDASIDQSLIRIELENAIMGAFPYTYQDKKKTYIYFTGEKQSLGFVSTLSPSYNNQITIWQLQANHKGGLDIRVSEALTGDPQAVLARQSGKAAEPTHVLADKSVRFSYLDKDKNGHTQWLNQWDGKQRRALPQAVKISLEAKEAVSTRNDQIIALIFAHEHQTIRKKQ